MLLALLSTRALPSIAQAAAPRFTVSLRAFPMSAFTKIPIDTGMIQVTFSMNTVLKHPARFVTELQAVLARKDTVSWHAFRPGFVRFWFHVAGPAAPYNLYVAQGATLVCGHRLYKLDRDLVKVLRHHIPEKDTYLALPKRRRQ